MDERLSRIHQMLENKIILDKNSRGLELLMLLDKSIYSDLNKKVGNIKMVDSRSNEDMYINPTISGVLGLIDMCFHILEDHAEKTKN